MSRFADPRATRRVDLGACECPGSPHDIDFAVLRGQLSSVEIARVAGADTSDEGAVAEIIAPFVVEWNLLGPDGQPWPPSADALCSLMAPTLTAITEALGQVMQDSASLPNASSAPSAASSRGSASRTPTTTPKPGT